MADKDTLAHMMFEQATPYIRALSALWGLGELHVISAENMDNSYSI